MKADVLEGGLPPIPRKRRQLEDQAAFLDLHIAMWLDGDITPSERRRLEEEKARRKSLRPNVNVGLIVGAEGLTPAQTTAAHAFLLTVNPTAVHWQNGTLKLVRKALAAVPDVPGEVHQDFNEVVRHSTTVIAFPKEPEKPNQVQGVWAGVRYAKHRSTPVRVVMPNGEER